MLPLNAQAVAAVYALAVAVVAIVLTCRRGVHPLPIARRPAR